MVIIEYPDEDAGGLLVQVTEAAPDGVTTRGLHVRPTMEKAERSFESTLGAIRSIADSVLGQLSGMGRRPDEVSVCFGLELTAHAGAAVLVGADCSAHIQVQLAWKAGTPWPSESGTRQGP